MARVIRISGVNALAFECPACRNMHRVPLDETVQPNGCKWTWNQDMDFPSFDPSIKIEEFEPLTQKLKYRCHSIVTGGKIAFQSDSTHTLAGQTVPLPEIE